MKFQQDGQYEAKLQSLLKDVTPIDRSKVARAVKRWDAIAKPLKGMGKLEDYIAQIAAINDLQIAKKAVAVFCADNGVVEEGVTQTGNEVTAIVAENITKGEATVVNMAKTVGADVYAYDVGMVRNSPLVPRLKSAMGSENFSKTAAMSREQAAFSILAGIHVAKELKEEGYTVLAAGEMGIGNTTTSSAVTAVLFDVDATVVTGKGAGLTSSGIVHKAKVINDSIALHQPDRKDPLDVLSKVGGFDIGGICGLFLGGGIYHLPVIIDGFIASVGALLATQLCSEAGDYMLPSHMSAEPAAMMVMEELAFDPALHCQMALGEGTGAVALMPLLDMAAAVFRNMPTFGDIDIDDYKPLD